MVAFLYSIRQRRGSKMQTQPITHYHAYLCILDPLQWSFPLFLQLKNFCYKQQSSVYLVSVHVPLLRKSSIASLARHQANAVEVATKVCFSLFDVSELLVSATKGKSCSVWRLGNLRLAYCTDIVYIRR